MTNPPLALTVCTFNIRYGSAPDGANHWTLRRQAAAATLRTIDADIVGLQECEAHQRSDLAAALPGYDWLGVGRDDGHARGEMCALLLRSGMFERLADGHFWFSDTPDVPGSCSWGNDLPRMATWARLRVLADAPHWPTLLVINTHLDHAIQPARLQAIALLRRFVRSHAAAAPIMTGDFNAQRPSAELTALTAGRVLTAAPTVGGTFHDFGGGQDGPAIDWILHDERLVCDQAVVVRQAIDGRYPSDHHPVVARLRAR